jgi:hypothetical protein
VVAEWSGNYHNDSKRRAKAGISCRHRHADVRNPASKQARERGSTIGGTPSRKHSAVALDDCNTAPLATAAVQSQDRPAAAALTRCKSRRDGRADCASRATTAVERDSGLRGGCTITLPRFPEAQPAGSEAVSHALEACSFREEELSGLLFSCLQERKYPCARLPRCRWGRFNTIRRTGVFRQCCN